MESELKPLNYLSIYFNRSTSTLSKWRSKGCAGFFKKQGMVYGNVDVIKEWIDQNQATKPGPKGVKH